MCNDHFDDIDAQVACQMMGFTGGEYLPRGFGDGTGPIFLDDVECDGTERDLLECDRNEWGEHNCAHYEDVGIRCGKLFSNECVNEWTAYARMDHKSFQSGMNIICNHGTSTWTIVHDDATQYPRQNNTQHNRSHTCISFGINNMVIISIWFSLCVWGTTKYEVKPSSFDIAKAPFTNKDLV